MSDRKGKEKAVIKIIFSLSAYKTICQELPLSRFNTAQSNSTVIKSPGLNLDDIHPFRTAQS